MSELGSSLSYLSVCGSVCVEVEVCVWKCASVGVHLCFLRVNLSSGVSCVFVNVALYLWASSQKMVLCVTVGL